MRATYDYIVRYDVTAKCLTPLRTGGADSEMNAILRTEDGQPFLQGPSLAGVMKKWAEAAWPMPADPGADPEGARLAGLAADLFGRVGRMGHVLVSDALFSLEGEMRTRPRVRLNSATGSAQSGYAFESAYMGTGSTLTFTLTWVGERKTVETELPLLEAAMAALHQGEIRLGGQQSNGFGRVALTIYKEAFDMTDPDRRSAWRAADWRPRTGGTPYALPHSPGRVQTEFTVKGRFRNVLVKGQDKRSHMREGMAAVIPGSSVKGALREQVRRIAAYLEGSAAGAETGGVTTLTDPKWENDLFGPHGGRNVSLQASKVLCSDVYIRAGDPPGVRPLDPVVRIRIDRFTGGVINQGTFAEKPLASEAELSVSLPAGEVRGCALVLMALRDLALGLWTLGGGWAIGRGVMEVDTITVRAPGDKYLVLTVKDGRLELDDPNGLWTSWKEALKA